MLAKNGNIPNFIYVVLGTNEMVSYVSIKKERKTVYVGRNSLRVRMYFFFTYCCMYDFVVRHTLRLDTMFRNYCIRNVGN